MPIGKRSCNVGIVFTSGTSHPPGRDKKVVLRDGDDAGALRFRCMYERGHGQEAWYRVLPTCNEPNGVPTAQIASKFAAVAEIGEIDMFAYGVGTPKPFALYWAGMKKFLSTSQ